VRLATKRNKRQIKDKDIAYGVNQKTDPSLNYHITGLEKA